MKGNRSGSASTHRVSGVSAARRGPLAGGGNRASPAAPRGVYVLFYVDRYSYSYSSGFIQLVTHAADAAVGRVRFLRS